MLVNNLLYDIGFTAEQQEQYFYYKSSIGNNLEVIAKKYMSNQITLKEALDCAHRFENENLHIYTLDLMFLLDCTSYLEENYQKAGISKEIFINTMKDLKYKLDECLSVKNIFGTFVALWYDGFFKLNRIALGRLQYDYSSYNQDTVTICGYTLNRGDFAVSCHIPSSGPLEPEMYLQSFKLAYKFFKDKINEKILVIICHSWLLYPPYQKVFSEKSNISNFVKSFKIIHQSKTTTFDDCWRIFGIDFDGDITKLSADTSLQKSFIEHIKTENDFGVGFGVILFDSENILTKQ